MQTDWTGTCTRTKESVGRRKEGRKEGNSVRARQEGRPAQGTGSLLGLGSSGPFLLGTAFILYFSLSEGVCTTGWLLLNLSKFLRRVVCVCVDYILNILPNSLGCNVLRTRIPPTLPIALKFTQNCSVNSILLMF